VREALDVLDRQGTPADYMRIRAFPFSESVVEFLDSHEFCFVVEQNRESRRAAPLAADARNAGAERKIEERADLWRISVE
jgi:2-oxoglutarate ferredoxin oxidoreductase subunit alpha